MTPKTTRLLSWAGPLPEPGDFLETKAGSIYLIFTVRPNRLPNAKSVAFLQLGKLDSYEKDRLPGDAVVHPFEWTMRGPGSRMLGL